MRIRQECRQRPLVDRDSARATAGQGAAMMRRGMEARMRRSVLAMLLLAGFLAGPAVAQGTKGPVPIISTLGSTPLSIQACDTM